MVLIDKVENRITNGINEAMNFIMIDRMPTSKELRSNGFQWLDSLIGANGGLLIWADKLNLNRKGNYTKTSTDVKEVIEEIKSAMLELNLNRMPSSSEISNLKENYILHNKIITHGGYRYMADLMSLQLKDSETKLGQDYEYIVSKILEDEGFDVKKMTSGHPFDLLINDTVKVDVKVARPHMLRGESRVHTFGINKRHGSCDIYITAAINESDEIEKILVIPSHHLKVVTLCIGKRSKYDIYNKKFEYIKRYADFFKAI